MQLSNSHKTQCHLAACRSLLDPETTLILMEIIPLLEHTPPCCSRTSQGQSSITHKQAPKHRSEVLCDGSEPCPTQGGELKALLMLNPA